MNIIKKLISIYQKKTNPIKYARKIGVVIGKNCKLHGSPNWGSEPWLISIGDYSEVSFECAFVTHDGAVGVIRREEKYKNVIKYWC